MTGDTGFRSRKNVVQMLARDAEKLCNLSFGPAGRWNHVSRSNAPGWVGQRAEFRLAV
jgi:hypothetical protein